MCGIAGFIGPPDHQLLAAMCETIAHRGPDGDGFHETPAASLGHRRLAIIDLEHGREPMSNAARDLQLVYNGEIYNFRELRAELEEAGRCFETRCDAEVVLVAYEHWGVECFRRFNGMWALAILDERRAQATPDGQPGHGGGKLLLSRDHLGIKPLYVAATATRYLFASEIKALLASPELVPAADNKRLAEYLARSLHDHDDGTFFAGVNQVLPATAVEIDLATRTQTAHRFWEPRLSSDGPADPATFRRVFKRAVERRLVADVPVGTCLSGGLDSSAIVCMMSQLRAEGAPDAGSMGEQLRTFSAVFDGDPIDEQEYIEPVLAASGAGSAFVRPKSNDLFEDLPLVVWHQDEPMVSSGPYAQYRVMELAKGNVKVLLDGQGGDELLAGYVPYQYVYLKDLAKSREITVLARETLVVRDLLTPFARARLHNRRRGVDPAKYCPNLLGDPEVSAAIRAADTRSAANLKQRLLQDLTRYSLPSLLRYEDRNSMAHSIESRPPFLDQELVELVLSLPPDAIVRDGWSRWIFRESMKGLLPDKIRLRRKKIGFTTPEMRWLRAERARVQGLLRSPSFCSRPYWDAPAVARAFKSACDGELEESPLFWRLINVEAWLRVFHGPAPLAPGGKRPGRSLEGAGDAECVEMLGLGGEAAAWASVRPNAGRHVFCCGPDGRNAYGRVPVRTPRIVAGDDLDRIVSDSILSVEGGRLGVEPGDIVAVSEKAVAVSQGRSFPVTSIKTGLLSKALSRLVSKGPAGIGLGIPATMQLAIEEAGAARILMATAAAGVTRVFGRHGTFYRVAGGAVSAIDGPTAGTLPPFDTHAKLPPRDPDGVAERLASRLADEAGGPVHVAVIDANDRGVTVLGGSRGLDRPLLAWLFGDNPLGQGDEQTPVALIRFVGRVTPARLGRAAGRTAEL
ncbi:MAG: asparagine synthase (glutamine-hydrolyzing) [Acidimicrobiales bacterium]